jgi:hypothetical protein
VQDSKTKDWWIYINEKGIGYYPSSLFSNMTSADTVEWAGKTTNPTDTRSPPMGYGVIPNGDLDHACYFKNLAFVDDLRKHQALQKDMGEIQSSNSNCYGVGYYVKDIGLTVQFGGPGGGDCFASPKKI